MYRPQKSFARLLRHLEDYFKKTLTIESGNKRLEVLSVRVDASKAVKQPVMKQALAKELGQSWSAPVKVRCVLYNGAQRIDEAEATVLRVPIITDFGTYIVNGTEYAYPLQRRLLPGAYAERKPDGSVVARVNSAKGTNYKMAWRVDQEDLILDVGGTLIQVPALLLGIGVQPHEMFKAWGKERAEELLKKRDARRSVKAMQKFYSKLTVRSLPQIDQNSPEELRRWVRMYLSDHTELDPDVMEMLHGSSHKEFDAKAILGVGRSILDVASGDRKDDDQDSLLVNKFVDISSFIIKRFNTWRTRSSIESKLERALQRAKKVTDIANASVFQSILDTGYTSEDIARVPKMNNPMDIQSSWSEITYMGAGAIGSTHAVTRSTRALHPTHFGFIDPVHTPEGSNIGTTVHLAVGVDVDEDGQLTRKVFDVRARRVVSINPRQFFKAKVAAAEFLDRRTGRLKPKNGRVEVMHRGDFKWVPAAEVQYAMPSTTSGMGLNTMAVPFLSHGNGTRAMTAAKMQSQAKSLKYREAPLVETALDEQGEGTAEEVMARSSLPKAPADGVIKVIDKDKITITTSEGNVDVPMYDSFMLNSGNFLDNKPLVEVGERVQKGQVLADSNYTQKGKLALGVNLYSAYMVYKGYNHEDGAVISEEAAERMTSLHMYSESTGVTARDVLDKRDFIAVFPTMYDGEQLDKIGDDGVIKKGQQVLRGQPLVLKHTPLEEDVQSRRLANLSRLLRQESRNTSLIWQHDKKGTVDRVMRRGKEIVVVVQTEEPMKIGDKIVGRYGNKFTITRIIPNDQMPRDKDGNRLELIMNPDTVPGRMNLGQVLELSASRIAKKDGQPYVALPFGGKEHERIEDGLKKRKISEATTIYDPEEDAEIEGIHAGYHYTLKLEHQVSKKMTARGGGAGWSYGISGQPSKSPGNSGRAVGINVLYAMLSHGATANLEDMFGFKGDKDLESWRAFETGMPMPDRKLPASTLNFATMLRGAGVDIQEQSNGDLKMTPFLDKDIAAISGGAIREATMMHKEQLQAERGGLFDLRTTGGLEGTKWSHIDLVEPMPHPMFRRTIELLLGITGREFDDIMGSKVGVIDGKIVPKDTPGAKLRGAALQAWLNKIDPQSRLDQLKDEARSSSGDNLDNIWRQARSLKNFIDTKTGLGEMVVSKVPVIPPKMRPVLQLPTGDLQIADVNEHYKALLMVNNQARRLRDTPGMRDDYERMIGRVADGYAGVVGKTSGLVTKPGVKGLVQTIAGTNPKSGYWQSKILKRVQDASGTAVIEPDPTLDMDTLGVPEQAAWKMFDGHARKELRSMGLRPLQINDAMERRTEMARDALIRAMDDTYVWGNRAPTLHKFSIMSFKPKLVSGYSLRVPVEVLGGFNADFDGDTFGIHAVVSDKAKAEASELVPSKVLFAPGHKGKGPVATLSREFLLGLYRLTLPGKTTAKSYRRPEEVVRDLEQKRVKATDIISIQRLGRTTPGKVLVNQALPEDMRDYQMTLDKKKVGEIFKVIAKRDSELYKRVITAWKHLGRKYAYLAGTSFLPSDLRVLSKERKQLYLQADREADRVRSNTRLSEEEKKRQIVAIYAKVDSRIMSMSQTIGANASTGRNNLVDMMDSGYSKPGINQIKQMVGAVGLLLDHNQQVMAEPVRGNYAEGLTSSEYFRHMYAQRKGMIDKSQEVIGPGALSKQLNNVAAGLKVTMRDCGTREGIMEDVGDRIIDRTLAVATSGIAAGAIISQDDVEKLKRARQTKVKVRSPMGCEAPQGICALCFGRDEMGRIPENGRTIGLSLIQSVTERSVQLPMKAFHSGGVASADSGLTNAFDRAVQILNMPQTIANKATLAQLAGNVESITRRPTGGYIVRIGGRDHKVGPKLELKVKIGQRVAKGDQISDGIIKTQELAKLRGLAAAQQNMSDSLDSTFTSAGVRLDRRAYETLTKLYTEQVRVVDSGDSPFMPGDYMTAARARGWNKANPGRRPIKYKVELKGALQRPYQTDDWASRMSLGYISDTVEKGVAMGFATNANSSPFARAAFGRGTRLPRAGRERDADRSSLML